jgi:hypothetical protein
VTVDACGKPVPAKWACHLTERKVIPIPDRFESNPTRANGVWIVAPMPVAFRMIWKWYETIMGEKFLCSVITVAATVHADVVGRRSIASRTTRPDLRCLQ